MFWHVLYFTVGQRWRLNKEDARLWFCLMKWYLQFSIWHWISPNLCDAGVLWWRHAMWSPEFCGLWGLVLMHLPSLFPAPDGPPQDVQLEPISSQSIRVTWKVNTHTSKNVDSDSILVHSNRFYWGEFYNNCGSYLIWERPCRCLCWQILKHLPLTVVHYAKKEPSIGE